MYMKENGKKNMQTNIMGYNGTLKEGDKECMAWSWFRGSTGWNRSHSDGLEARRKMPNGTKYTSLPIHIEKRQGNNSTVLLLLFFLSSQFGL